MSAHRTPRFPLGKRVLIAGRYGNVERVEAGRYLIRCDDGSEGWAAETEIEPIPGDPPRARGAAA
jgi:hypothetical protein